MRRERPFGAYTLLRRLAVGGMAEIYLAKTRGLGGFEKLVAIKLVHPHLSADPQFVRMLVAEAKILVLLTHANIAQVFDLGCIDGTYYIAMEYVDGVDVHALQELSRHIGQQLPLAVCCYIVAEMLNGLDYAHRKRDAAGRPLNLVHRDISPQNVMMSQAGEIKLVDFGIAKSSLQGERTDIGVIKGKYYYMSPEHAWGDTTDRRSDVFSAGVLLHEMLTGRMLYSARSVPELIAKVRRAEVVDPVCFRTGIPPSLSAIVMKALRHDPAQRYQSALDMGEALRDVLYQEFPTFNASKLSQFVAQLLRARPERVASDITQRLRRLTRHEFVRTESSVLARLPESIAPPATRNEVVPRRAKRPTSPKPGTQRDASSAGTPAAQASSAPPQPSGVSHADDAGVLEDPTMRWSNSTDSETTLVQSPPSELSEENATQEEDEEAPTLAFGEDDAAPTSRYSNEAVDAVVGRYTAAAWGSGGGARSRRARRATPALVPPPGDVPTVQSIPPSPPVPDFRARTHGRRTLNAVLLVVLMLALGGLVFQVVRQRAGSAELDLISVPAGATVRVDGQVQKRTTPLRLKGLKAGNTYTVSIERPGYRPWKARYRATSGKARQLAVLEPLLAELSVTSKPPAAEVYLDGSLLGRTPLTVRAAVGSLVNVRVRRHGFREQRRSIQIEGSELKPHVSFELVPVR